MLENQNGTYLVHHGILGQKWGKKNGPPYPLDASDHSAAEKRAAEGKGYGVKTNKTNRPIKSGLTDSQKKKVKTAVKVGAATCGTALAAYGTYKVSKFVGPAQTKAGVKALNAMSKAVKAGKEAGKIAKENGKKIGKEYIKGYVVGEGGAGFLAGKMTGFTVTSLAIKELMDIALGENTYKVIKDTYNANHKKEKIDLDVKRRINNTKNNKH